jgi:selenide, water dikinase
VSGAAPVRLTSFARGGGCAAKVRLGELSQVLDRVAPQPATIGAVGSADCPSHVLVAHEYSDDAAVVTHPDGQAMVLTADVIAPLVDDPETFGAIAATNSMSDVWAMGGEPRFALNLVFFPDDQLPLDVLHAILRGGERACARAGVVVVGGHTVRDPEVKYGMSVTGVVAPGAVLSNRGAHAGEVLVLSKALGTGVISQAIKSGEASAAEIEAACTSMTTLNRDALVVGRRHGVTAATDVTGFSLLGHLRNILRGSGLAATIELAALPLLPGAHAHASAGRIPGGSKANRNFMTPRLRWTTPPDDVRLSLACDAQTSGGLLLCLPPDRADACVRDLRELGLPAAIVGALHGADPEQPERVDLR